MIYSLNDFFQICLSCQTNDVIFYDILLSPSNLCGSGNNQLLCPRQIGLQATSQSRIPAQANIGPCYLHLSCSYSKVLFCLFRFHQKIKEKKLPHYPPFLQGLNFTNEFCSTLKNFHESLFCLGWTCSFPWLVLCQAQLQLSWPLLSLILSLLVLNVPGQLNIFKYSCILSKELYM